MSEEIFGCLTATDMELIDGSEIVNGYPINRFAKELDPAADRSSQVAMGVVIGDILLESRCMSRLLNKIQRSFVSLPSGRAGSNVRFTPESGHGSIT